MRLIKPLKKRIFLCLIIFSIGLSSCQTETAIFSQVQSTTTPSRYAVVAKGIELNQNTVKVDPTRLKADFGIIDGGAGWNAPFLNYETNILAFDQAKISWLLLWDILIPPEMDASNLDKSFPPEQEEPNVAAIVKAAKNKSLAGIIIRFQDKKLPDGKEFTQGWMANYISWIVQAVYHQNKKPLYIMTSQAFVNGFGNAPELNQVLSGMDGMCSWKAMRSETSTLPAAWDAFPIPQDDYVPEYISNNKSLYFINYARKAFKLDGIEADSTPLWIYTRPSAQFKKDLGIK